MHRINTATAGANTNGTGKAGFVDGTPGSVAPTDLNSSWFNATQEEVALTVEGAGIALSTSNNAQLLQAINRLNARARGDYALGRWFSRTMPASLIWTCGAYSPTKGYVALANTGVVGANSFDGQTWVSRTVPTGSYADCCWSPALGLFCAVIGSSGTAVIATSPDGVTWTAQSLPSTSIPQRICWADTLGLFVLVCTGSSTTTAIYTSTNGVTWIAATVPAGYNSLNGVAWSNALGKLVAVASSGTAAFLYSSTGTGTWLSATTPSAGGNAPSQVSWSPELAKFLATYQGSWQSPDAINWTYNGAPNGVVGANRQFWMPELGQYVGTNTALSGGGVQLSYDGITWTQNLVSGSGLAIGGAIYGGAPSMGLIALANSATTVASQTR